MLGRLRIDPEPDPVYVELVSALFDVDWPLWTAGLLFTALGIYLAVSLGDPVTVAITLCGSASLVPRLLLSRAFRHARRARADVPLDPRAAAGWELRFCMGLILFYALVSALTLRMFALGDPTFQLLTIAMMFGFASGSIARVSVRPLVCMLSLSVMIVPIILAAWLDATPHHGALAIGLLLFLFAALGTVLQGYDAARHHITIAHEMGTVARNDPLTGLLNRFGLRHAFAAIVPVAHAPMLAVHYCDLDGFKPINDLHGHPAGDAVLAQVGVRLRAMLRTTDLAARIGGDEFVVIQSPVRHGDEVAAFAAALKTCFLAPYPIARHEVRVGASIGSALATAPRPDLDRLLADADRALYAAKQARRDPGD